MLSRSGKHFRSGKRRISCRSVLSCSGSTRTASMRTSRPSCRCFSRPRRRRKSGSRSSAGAASLPSKARPPSAATPGTSPTCGASGPARGTRTPRLPDALQRFLPELKRPKLVVAYAFDILPPQTKEFLDALVTEIAFCRPDPRSATVSRAAFDSAKHEIEAAARWARARLEAGGKRIGVVIPSLQEGRKEVARVFSRVMRPGGEKAAMPFNISIGIPLERYPVVALALSVLRVSQEEIPFEEASRLVRSPFIGGAETELGARMRLEARLREKLGASVVLPKLIAAAGQTPLLRARLEKLYALRETGLFSQKTPAEWARHFSSVLEAAGFPGERALDSDEFQTQAKWHEALGELSRLDRISKEMSFSQAFQTLRKIGADTLFQPETP